MGKSHFLKKLNASGLNSELARNSAQTFGIRVLGIALAYVFSLAVTNWLGPAAFGDYTFLVLIVNVLSIGAALGLDALVVRFASGRAALEDWAGLKNFNRQATRWQIAAACLAAMALWWAFSLGWITRIGSAFVFSVAALCILPQTLLKYRSQAFKALRHIRYYAVFNYLATPLLALFFLGLFWKIQQEKAPGLAHLAAVWTAATAAYFLWKKTLGQLPENGLPPAVTERATGLLRQSWPFLLTGSVMFLNNWADQLVLKTMRGSYELGIYAAGSRVVSLVTIPLMAVNSIVAPRLARLWAQEDLAGLRQAAQQATRLIFWTSAPIFLIILVFAEFLMQLFGDEFAGGAMAMRILVLGQCFNVLVGPTGAVLNMTRYERLMNRLAVASLMVNVAVSMLLSPQFGAAGAACGSALGLAVLNSSAWWSVRRRLGFSTIKI